MDFTVTVINVLLWVSSPSFGMQHETEIKRSQMALYSFFGATQLYISWTLYMERSIHYLKSNTYSDTLPIYLKFY